MKWDHGRFSAPHVRRRLSLGVLVLAALLAGCGGFIRASSQPGSSPHSAGYLFDAAGWMVALFGALIEISSSDLFFQIGERKAKRRAISLTLVGLLTSIGGCYVASFVLKGGSSPVLSAGANGLLVGGIGSGLAGLFSLAWFYGGSYAARRVEHLTDEEW